MSAEAIDVVISFDTTGSMYPCLTQLRRNADQAVRRLFEAIPALHVGVLAHGDYCDQRSTYLLKKVDLTGDEGKVLDFIKNVGASGGGDAPEAYEYALHEARGLAWRSGRSKVLVMIGDDVPHEPSYPENKQKLDWRNELELLTAMGVKVYGVHAMPGCRQHSKAFYTSVAKRTGGFYLTLDQFAYITDMILAIAYKQHGDEHLTAFEAEVDKASRMNNSMKRVFSTMLGRVIPPELEEPDYTPAPAYHHGAPGFAHPAGAVDVEAEVKSGKLRPVPMGRFQVIDVDVVADIRTFINSQGIDFKPGRGFYQLTKSELVQEKKEVVLMEKKTGHFFSGDPARALLGLKPGERAKVHALHLDKYLVFIQSTSYNRKLVAGTKLLYEVPDWDHSGATA